LRFQLRDLRYGLFRLLARFLGTLGLAGWDALIGEFVPKGIGAELLEVEA
jgi:hypothetical protein